VSPERDSDFVPFVALVPLVACPLLHWIVQEKRLPSGSLIGMLQVRVSGLLVELLVGDGVPKTGGRLTFVVNVYHFLVYRPLPLGSVAFTQIL